MKWICSVTDAYSAALIGGKAQVLFDLYRDGYQVPRPLCITTEAYEYFTAADGLLEKINLELNRKAFVDMRWEELWDTALRIKSYFRNQPFPPDLECEILTEIERTHSDLPLVIRSSAPGEDSKMTSFAGLHDSCVDVRGRKDILAAVKRVWASLWSDRALLYRQELGLEVSSSTMAILVQPLEQGEVSGITFSRHPLKDTQAAVEAVYGLNSGLVDGTIEPDRWFLQRDKLERVEHIPPNTGRTRLIHSPGIGLTTEDVAGGEAKLPPLGTDQVKSIAQLALTLEKRFHTAQDIEWTLSGQTFWLLQSRPVTAARAGQDGDKRSWYLSLHRSYHNLIELWDEIENSLLPDMDRDSDQMAAVDLTKLSNASCAQELQHRLERNNYWTGIYWSTFIPFAHGVRLFGEIYNDTMLPDDPFEFVSLLAGESMLGVRRNKLLAECAHKISKSPLIKAQLQRGDLSKIEDNELVQNLELLEKHYGLPPVGDGTNRNASDSPLLALLDQYADVPAGPERVQTQKHRLEKPFLEQAKNVENLDPSMLLALARASYRLRDDDNIHIGRIAAQLERAAEHARQRLANQGRNIGHGSIEELIKVLHGEALPAVNIATHEKSPETAKTSNRVKARQLIGQPASEGLARGNARVVENGTGLDNFQAGEILVCDAIDPTMTFFAPLAAAIVERRGGMLIHGAIIAREYGIPCVTGIADATRYIQNGDYITVDGYLGIVIRESSRD